MNFLKLEKEEKALALADFESERVRLHMELKSLRSKEEAAEREKNSAQQQIQLLKDKNENLSENISEKAKIIRDLRDADHLRVQFERDLELQKATIDRLQFESKILFEAKDLSKIFLNDFFFCFLTFYAATTCRRKSSIAKSYG